MNPLYTYRPFIHRERTDINEYLEESPVWKELHKIYMEAKGMGYKTKLSPLRLFNEVHYLCVRLMLDPCPEKDFTDYYLPHVISALGSHATGLCFSMVYAVLNILNDPPEHIPGFLRLLRSRYYAGSTKYSSFYKKFAPKTGEVPLDLTPCPERPDSIKEDAMWWRRATGDFRQSRIREIVNFWPALEEKLEVALIIEEQFKQAEKKTGKRTTLSQKSVRDFSFFSLTTRERKKPTPSFSKNSATKSLLPSSNRLLPPLLRLRTKFILPRKKPGMPDN